MNDPFLDENLCYERLKENYNKYGSLLVAADFDETIFDYHKKSFAFPALIQLLKDCNKVKFPITIFTASPLERHPEIQEYCNTIGVEIVAINENTVDWMKDGLDRSKAKIYFSILLDDKAGLPSAYRILRKLIDEISEEKH